MVVSKRLTSTFLLKESSFSTQFLASANSMWSENKCTGGKKTEKIKYDALNFTGLTQEHCETNSWVKLEKKISDAS